MFRYPMPIHSYRTTQSCSCSNSLMTIIQILIYYKQVSLQRNRSTEVFMCGDQKQSLQMSCFSITIKRKIHCHNKVKKRQTRSTFHSWCLCTVKLDVDVNNFFSLQGSMTTQVFIHGSLLKFNEFLSQLQIHKLVNNIAKT